MNASRLILDFLVRPDFYWENNSRQLEKTRSRVSGIENYYGWSKIGFVNILLSIAKERISHRVDTLYLPSFGSSGSHLMQHVLHKIYGMIGLGEIYLPPKLKIFIEKELCIDEQNVFIEAYHLIHAHPKNLFLSKEVINTAHYPDLNGYRTSTKNFKKGLILRNPVDVVISRTFRKSEYREYLGKDEASDFSYLKENVKKAKKFYGSALSCDFDHFFFYEDLVSSNPRIYDDIINFVGRGNRKAVGEELSRAINEGATNKYSGPKVEVPSDCLEYAATELSEIAEKIQKLKGR